nr:type IV secretion protein Rhs [uncultured Actinomyces sp.]
MALCLFGAVAFAIPGFTARAHADDSIYVIPNTTFLVTLEDAFDFEAKYGKTGYWGVILDNGRVTPNDPPSFERHGEIVTPTANDLWKAVPLNSYTMIVPVPNGTNNIEGVTWEPGTNHRITIVTYKDDQTLAENVSYSVTVYKPYTPEPTPDPTVDPAPEPTVDPAPEPQPEPTVDPAPEPQPVPTVDPAPEPQPEPTVDPAPEPQPEPTADPQPAPSVIPVPAPQPDDPQLPPVQPSPSASATPSPTPSASANATQPSDTPVSPISDESQLTDANKGGVSAAFTGGQLTINVPADKAVAGEWVSANIMQTGEARWLQVENDNRVTMDVTGLPMGDYKVVVANRSHQLVGWAEFKVASTVAAAGAGAPVDASSSFKLHAEVLSASNGVDESEGLNGYLLGAGACMLILGGLVVLQVLSGPKIGSTSDGVTLT